MEERPWTKSEFFAWSDGRRIVDLYELSKQLHCKQCRSLLDLGRTEREARYGLASVLYILCNCGVMNDVHTGRTQQDGGGSNSPSPMYEINIKASINLLMYGAGASRILSFLALLDIPVPPPDDTSLIVPVTEDADIQNASSALGLPPSSSTTTATAKSAPPAASAATSESTAPFQKPAPSSTAPSSFTPEPDFRSVPLPPRDDEDEDNDDALQEDIDNEDDENDMDDDDEEYVPTSKPKPKAKPKPTPAPKKKSLLRGPKSARAKQAAKLAAKKKAPVKLKVKIKKENVETQKKAADESEKQGDENVKQYVDPMDWSSSETETESVQGKNKGSDDSWHEDDYDGRDDEDVGSRPKRKRGRPKGSPEKGKRQRRSGSQKAKGESSSPKKTRVKAESKEVPRCTTCNKEFTSAKGYNVHMKRVHNQEMKGKRGPKQHAGVTKAGWMKSDFQAKEEAMRDSIFVCPICKKPCCRDNSLTTHMQKAHQREITDTAPYAVSLEDVVLKLVKDHHSQHFKCLKCNTVISSRLKLSAHLCVDQAGALSCKTLCPDGLGLSNWQRVIFLKRRREYLCHTCGANFTDKTTFTMHVQSHRMGVEVKKFVCEHCPYTTNNKFYFKIHMRGQHSAEPRPRPHVCELCGKTFVFKGVLEQHKQYMHVKDKIFQCHLCPKFFYRRQGLARHVRTHSGQRPWVCTHCGQGFTVKYNLKVHERLHSGEKPYKCEHCDAAFAQKNSLNVHMKKHKGGGGEVSATRAYRAREKAAHPPASEGSSASRDTEGVEPFIRDMPLLTQHSEGSSPAFDVPNPMASRQLTSPPIQPQVRDMGDQTQSRESPMGGAPMQYGYPPYPDLTMPVFPSLPSTSYQFMPVTRP